MGLCQKEKEGFNPERSGRGDGPPPRTRDGGFNIVIPAKAGIRNGRVFHPSGFQEDNHGGLSEWMTDPVSYP